MDMLQFMKRLLINILGIGMLLVLNNCGTERPAVKKPEVKDKVQLSFTAKWGVQNCVFNELVSNLSNGEKLNIKSASFIFSKIHLISKDNKIVTLGDGYGYLNFVSGKTILSYENVPAGDYKGIGFQLGPDSAQNHGDPTIWPAEHPLNANFTGMHWGWAGGYIFSILEGVYEKTSGGKTENFSYHAAGNQFNKNYSIYKDFTITPKSKINIGADFKNFFEGMNNLKIEDQPISHSVGSSEEKRIRDILENSGYVFSIQSVEN